MRKKIFILKWVDRLIGKPAVILLSKFIEFRGSGVQGSGTQLSDSLTHHPLTPLLRFLIVRPGGIGDAALLFPALNELRKSFPACQIHVLAEKRNAEILKICKSIDRLYLYDRGLDIFRALRNTYDVVIDTEQWHRLSAAVACLTGAQVRIGFSTNERERLFTHTIEYSHTDYEANSFLKLVNVVLNHDAQFNIEKQFINRPELKSGPGLIPKRNPESQIEVALFMEASVKEKEWGVHNFLKLADRLVQKGIRVILIGKKYIPEIYYNQGKMNKVMGSGVMNLTGRLSLTETIMRLSGVDLLITGDSGIMHIAYGLGIPTISLFGSGVVKKWAPKGKNHTVINKGLPCSPCTKFSYIPPCPRDVECMRAITVDEVEEAVLRLISQIK
jgi:ADP-heptose:LPS heptosyltransferase